MKRTRRLLVMILCTFALLGTVGCGNNTIRKILIRPERRQTGQWKRTAKQRESFGKEPQECKKIPVVFF